MDLDLLHQALDGFLRRLDTGTATQEATTWQAPTPCAAWDVRTLVNHVVGELLWVPPLLEGKTIAEVGDRFDGDVLGDDPHATARRAADELREAAGAPGAQERTVHLSFGDFSGADYLGQIASDVVIHSWDLAKATGGAGDDDLGEDLVNFVDAFLTPQIDAWRSAGAFGPVVPTAPDATRQQRLIASTGRDPDWTPPPPTTS